MVILDEWHCGSEFLVLLPHCIKRLFDAPVHYLKQGDWIFNFLLKRSVPIHSEPSEKVPEQICLLFVVFIVEIVNRDNSEVATGKFKERVANA